MNIDWIVPNSAFRLAENPVYFQFIKPKLSYSSANCKSRALDERVNWALPEIYDGDQSGFGNWCDEMSPVMPEIGHAQLFEVERCAMAPRGVLTRGVHFNGFVRTNGKISMWIAHRENHISVQPSKLDQIVGGFLPAGEDPVKQLTEEARAEAGIHVAMLRDLVSVGAVDFCMRLPLGTQRGHCLVCNLQIPALFTPVNKGSVVGEFSLMPPKK